MRSLKPGRLESGTHNQNPAAGEAFVAELDQAIALIGDHPNRWPSYDHHTRRYLLRRFPYSIIYRTEENRITVVAVAHGRRKPGYWRKR
ncbi:MAG: type II toxin-antitoxin system RelE/ParE family toxin [Nitrospira sp.]|nr:type II toxin-antitoxin system RelE/ParE family toxin [Nitrospira sp.]